MAKQPLVSVIIPFYNRQTTLGRAMDSILAQTYQNFELVMVDDGSTDRGADIVKAYQKKDKRIKLFHLSKNHGIGYARQFGIDKARGEYIMWQDSDDTCDKNRIAKQLQFLQKNKKRQVVGTRHRIIRLYGLWGFGIKKMTGEKLPKHHAIPVTYMVRRSVYRTIKIRPLRIAEDLDWIFRFIEPGGIIYVLPDYLYFCYRTDKTLSRSYTEQSLSMLLVRLARQARLAKLSDPLVNKKNMTTNILLDFYHQKYKKIHPLLYQSIKDFYRQNIKKSFCRFWLAGRYITAIMKMKKLINQRP